MRVRTDDDLHKIDSFFLGPPQFTFPWKATYTQYFLWAAGMVFLCWVISSLGQSVLSSWGILAGIVSITFSTVMSRVIRLGHSFSTIARAVAHEIGAPRLPKNFQPQRISIGSEKE